MPAVIWAIVILVLCLMPKSELPSDGFFIRIPHFDKLVHGVLFGGLFATLFWAAPRRWLSNLLVCLVYGALVEILQDVLQTGRSAEWLDLLANAVGATFAALVALLVRRRAAV